MNITERVDRVMTEAVLSVDVEEPAGNVLRLFAGYPIHHLPVLSEQKVVGMLSSADMMKLNAFLPKTGMPPDEYLDQHLSVRTLMGKSVTTIRPHQSLIEAAQLMASHGFHALPVVDGHGRLLGIITTTDIMHAALNQTPRSDVAATTAVAVQPRDTRLTAAAFDQAIACAKTAIDADEDQHGIATALLYLQHRVVLLERVVQIADRYLSHGQDQSLHVTLLKAVSEAKQSALVDSHDAPAPDQLGLVGD